MLQPGQRLGPYEVVAPLGAGGMGEVYRARDPRLSRDVALKVLPEGIARDAELLARLEEEARATSALNHPSIVVVHEVGQAEDRRFIVMELVEGESLRQVLARGPLPVREAVRIAAQVAEGLAAAHAHGIVHRDLKPENVMVTRDGRAKILDFGLSRRSAVAPSRPGDTLALRQKATAPGLVVGTVTYMSPEQVRAEEVDHRSDVFSFGVVLFEILTGKPPFRRPTPAETMAAVLTEDPPPLSNLLPSVPPALERVVARCLEKNRERRFHSAHDLAFALEALSWVSVSVPPEVTALPGPRRRRAALVAAAAGVLLLVAAGAGLLATRAGGRPEAPSFRRITFSRGAIRSARFAPDGKTVVYGAAWEGDPIRLFTTQAESPESRRLELPDGDVLSVSAQGEMAVSLGRRFLTLHLGVGTLARAPLAGRAPRELLEGVQDADWAPDGETLCVVRDVDGRNRLELPAGTVLYETEGWLSHPRVSPKGDLVAFMEHPLRWDDRGFVSVVDVAGKGKRVASQTWQSAGGLAWGPDGREIWFTGAPEGAGRELHATTPDGKERVVLRVSGNLTLQDVSRDGRALVSDDKWRRRVFYAGAPGEREREVLIQAAGTFRPRELYVGYETSTFKKVIAFYAGNVLFPVTPRRTFIPLSASVDVVLETANRERPDILVGYGGWLDIFFSTLEARGLRLEPPKLVMYMGEALPHGARERIERGFGIPVLSRYNAVESFKIGYMCGERTG
ncbi:hypothetical protein FBQ97_17495, partial [Acidobacteria bacterium ACD]|nr:hypothetical protein [Acidobacteria bacterium ACD]